MALGRWFSIVLVALAILLCLVNLQMEPLVHQRRPTSQSPDWRYLDVVAVPESDNLEPIPRPPLSSIVNGYNITGDASWLLNFAVVGFPKCGTSTLMHHLKSHPEISMFKDERCENAYNQHAVLIKDLYQQFPASTKTHRVIRGIKCPIDLESTKLSMRNYKKWFPKTDFIAGIRHPVLRFESFYNFRVHNEFEMPDPTKLIGSCQRGFWGVCTDRSNFHISLSNLGKTLMGDDEKAYIDPKYHRTLDRVRTDRRIFLYEVSQLSELDPSLSLQFRTDLQYFLHLQSPIDPFIWFKPGLNHTKEKRSVLDQKKINICDDKYQTLRDVLMHQSQQASQWIRQFFMKANGVVVSNPEHFRKLLEKWEVDPCTERYADGQPE